ncbi:hypothetical protein S40293_02203 [Stachybotrys chartarum IBT 40293]|nr:hypothetical protein S40293_02203 [Stachybotrys chartarum IBT 40293]
MLAQFGSAALVAAALLGWTAQARTCDADLTVATEGGLVHGSVDAATPGVRQFLGIPYGQPPLGDLRFAPPRPAQPFGELNATAMPPSCMQFVNNVPNILNRDVLELNLGGLNDTTGPISEDCLTVSIWAPRGAATADLPVIVFFYGGAFMVGGVDVPYQIPAQWVQRSQDLVVVSFNHRDNIFGFPNAAGLPLEEQNVGLRDQRLAMEWVRDNIAAFGGDPSRIGFWGHSSGACAIAYYSFEYRDDPIANSVILHSGNEYIDILTRDPIQSNFTFVAAQVGCGDLGPEEELACMRTADPRAMAAFIGHYYDTVPVPNLSFSPIIDDVSIFQDYTALFQSGQVASLPALIGSTAQDGVSFVPYDPVSIDTALADLTTSFWFFCPSYLAARNRIAAGAGPVYRFLYSGNFTNVSPRPWMGAWHGSELPMLFGTHPLYRGDSTAFEYLTSEVMQDSWRAFVASAGRDTGVEGWDAWDEVEGGQVAEFGNEVPVRLIDSIEMEAACGF